MNNERIEVMRYCEVHDVEAAFIESLAQAGLIELVMEEQQQFLAYDTLPQLERFISWHYELDINTSGIETINYLLQRMQQMENELRELRGRAL